NPSRERHAARDGGRTYRCMRRVFYRGTRLIRAAKLVQAMRMNSAATLAVFALAIALSGSLPPVALAADAPASGSPATSATGTAGSTASTASGKVDSTA